VSFVLTVRERKKMKQQFYFQKALDLYSNIGYILIQNILTTQQKEEK